MSTKPPGLFNNTEMPNAGWWEALWPDPAGVLARVGMAAGMDVIDPCSGDGWFTCKSPSLHGTCRHRHRAGAARSGVHRAFTIPVFQESEGEQLQRRQMRERDRTQEEALLATGENEAVVHLL
jgi:hypothetical protein